VTFVPARPLRATPVDQPTGARGRPSSVLIVFLAAVGLSAGVGAIGGNNPVLAVASVGAVLLAVSMAIRPDVAAFVVVGVLYSNAAVIAVQFHGVPAFAAVAVPILLIVPVGYELIVRRRPVVITSAFPLMIVFFLVQILGTIFADDVASAYDELVTFVVEGIGLYFLITNTIRSVDTLRWVVWVLLAVGTFIGVLSFYQDATKTYDNDYGGFAQMSDALINTGSGASAADAQPRLAGPIGETNRYAQIMLMLVPLGLFWAVSARKRVPKLLAFGAAGAASLGVALTFSRGAAVGFALVVLIMIVLGYIKPIQIFLIGIAVALLLIAVPTYGNRVGSLVDLTSVLSGDTSGGSPDGAVLSRATEGIAALLVFADHPLIGVGPGRFPSYYRLYADEVGIRVLNADRQAHDLYLHIAAETGILGLIAFMGILGLTLRDLIRVRKRWLKTRPEIAAMATGLMLAVVTYMTTGLFLHLSYARYFWLVLAVAGAAGYLGIRLPDSGQEEATSVSLATSVAAPSSGRELLRRRVTAPSLIEAQRRS
jgi:putative inorganic carbon (hco3(-)) transporter